VRTGAMSLSAFLTGIGGSLFAQYFLYLDPTHVISPELSFQFALLPALGGLGTAIGPVLGSFAIIPLSELLRSYLGEFASGLHLAIYGGVLVVVMLYFPGGIASAIKRAGGSRRKGRPRLPSWRSAISAARWAPSAPCATSACRSSPASWWG
jgi:branched-chain amino acid transport system permease protein